MKKRISAFLSIICIAALMFTNATALSAEDKPYFFNVIIDKEGEILGDGDIINISCELANFDNTIEKCVCLINAYSTNISVDLFYNEETKRFEGSYTFGETIDNPTRACYIMMISSPYVNNINTYYNEETHPFGRHEFIYCNNCKDGIHYPIIDQLIAPTCTDAGKTEGSHCSLCGTVIKSQEGIPATGHNYVNGTCDCGEQEPEDETGVFGNKYAYVTRNAAGTYDVSFIGGIKKLDGFKKVGFEVKIGTTISYLAGENVYSSIVVNGETKEASHYGAEYLFVSTIEEIKGGRTIKIKPYAVDENNKRVYHEDVELVLKI